VDGKRLLIAALACALALLGGCTAPPFVANAGFSAAQSTAEAFVHGDMEVAERVPLAAAFAATHNAMIRLELPIEKETLYDKIGFVTSRETSGRRVKVVLTRISATVTEITVRVGVWGDAAVSKLVMVEIQEQLTPEWGPPAVPLGRPPP
jgi:ribosomal protein S12 methylthiotransferase accessory factor YcaO